MNSMTDRFLNQLYISTEAYLSRLEHERLMRRTGFSGAVYLDVHDLTSDELITQSTETAILWADLLDEKFRRQDRAKLAAVESL